MRTTGETVEKVAKQILGGDAEKNDFTECATINDLTIMEGRETPKNQALTILKGFSTVSEEVNESQKVGEETSIASRLIALEVPCLICPGRNLS